MTAILWELLEYVTFIRDSPEVTTAYTDTLGDLGLGLSGSVVAGLLLAWTSRSKSPDPQVAGPNLEGQDRTPGGSEDTLAS